MKYKSFLCLELLNTFSKKEIRQFEQFVTHPYFNTDQYVISLLSVLVKYALGSDVFDDVLQVKAYTKVFPNNPKPAKVLEKKQRDLLNAKASILTRLAEQFLCIEKMEGNVDYKSELLYGILLERKQLRLFDRHIKKDKKQLAIANIREVNYHHHNFKIEQHQLHYFYQTGRLRDQEDNLEEVVYHFDLYYLLQKLSLHLTALSLRHLSVKKQYELEAIKASTASLLVLPQYAEHPLVMLFSTAITLYEKEDDTTYSDLLELLNCHDSIVPKSLLKSFYTTATVYCASQIGLGNSDYFQKMFELHEIMHEKNLLIENNIIPVQVFKNMITIACRVGEFGWANEVLEYYREYIREPIRDSVYYFNLGAIAFYQKDFEAAHDKFIQVGKVNTVYDDNVRFLLLKCLYEKEQEYNEATEQAFNTAKKYFSHHKSMTALNKKGYQNFIQILIYLYRIRHGVGKMKLPRIQEKLEQQTVNSDRRWLLEKIGELG